MSSSIPLPEARPAGTAEHADLDGMLHAAGSGGMLFDPGNGVFQMTLQQRLWGLQDLLAQAELPGLSETVVGMNNLLLLFDPLALSHAQWREQLQALWPLAPAKAIHGREHRVPVDYGGEHGEDMHEICAHLGLSVQELAERHSAGHYTVACVGSMPGFGYLSGLDPALAVPRRQTPRTHVPKGSVMIGGAQTGIHPSLSPSGWNILGRTDLILFSPDVEPPSLLAPGDRIRFTIRSVTP